MKICIPITSFGKAGGFKVLINLANKWSELGHQVTIIVHASTEQSYYSIHKKVNVIKLNNHGQTTNVSIPFSVLSSIKSLYWYLKNNSLKYDAVIANHYTTAYPIFLGSKTNNFFYIQAYEPEFFNERKGLLKKSIPKFIAWCSYYLPLIKIVNSNMYTRYKNITAKHISYPGIDLDIFFPKPNSLMQADHEIKIGCIGRNEKWKGSEDVAKAIEILHNKGYDNIKLYVAFNAVSYSRHVLVKPNTPKELSKFYRSVDIMVTPGHIQLDAIHYPVIESMASGTSLITTGYYPASHTNSYIVPVADPLAIAYMIIHIINNPVEASKKRKNALNDIKQFSWDVVAPSFINILSLYIDKK